MPLSFVQANYILFLTQIGYAILNVVQAYVLVDLGNNEFGWQFAKTILGSSCFLILLAAREKRLCEQIKLIWSNDYFYFFIFCCISLSMFELSLIITMNDLGPTMVAIGIACTGSVSYMINIIARIESPALIKVFGSTITVSGACLAIYFCWSDSESQNAVKGAIAMGTMIFSMVAFFTLQKFLYPTFTVVFVTGSTFFTSCFLMFFAVLAAGTFDIQYTDYTVLGCLFYSSVIGQFLLYIATNSANQVLSSPMILLYTGLQPIMTPFFDICRTCYFPQSSGDCALPEIRILFAALLVTCGLCLYAWGEYEMTPSDIEGGSYTQLEGETGFKPKKTYLRKTILLPSSI